MAAAGLGYWDGESPGPNHGVTEAETLEAVRLAWELGNDVNAVTDYGVDLPPLPGDADALLFVQPLNLQTSGLALGDLRWAGSTALHGAVFRGSSDVVKFLVEKGARLDVRNRSGWTPLTVAGGYSPETQERVSSRRSGGCFES